MEKKFALHVNINQYNHQAFRRNNIVGTPQEDIFSHELVEVAQQNNYQSQVLLNETATASNVKQQLTRYSRMLKANDEFMFTFTGQISYAPASARHENAGDTLHFYDQTLTDDELLALWNLFPEDVKIVFIREEI